MSTAVALIAGCTATTMLVRGIGPALLGGRELPEWFQSVVVLLAPALLAALIVTQTLAHGHHIHVGANAVGVLAGGLVAWRLGSVVGCVVVAAALTAALRAL
jgi:branched-subunit amino acid transport protein